MDGTTMTTAVIAILSVFGSSFGIIYLFLRTRNKERMALIEKGKDATIFSEKYNLVNALKWGLVVVGLGLGLFVGGFLEKINLLHDGTATFSMLAIFAGLGLLTFYKIAKDKNLIGDM